MDLQWWIVVIEVPVVGGLVAAIMAQRRSQSEGDKALHRRVDDLLEKFGKCQRDSAMTFVSKDDFREDFKRLESRFEVWMDRIEQKLDELRDNRPKGGR